MTDRAAANILVPPRRDLRLDLLRGLGQWMVFLDHVPYDVMSWLTTTHYGFSDATEGFVFISGYCVGYVCGPPVRGGQLVAAAKRLWRRAWQLYLAHLFIVLLFAALLAFAARLADQPRYEHEYNVFRFLQHPDVMIAQVLALRYKPVNLDVLPLFVVLTLASPAILWGLVRQPMACLFGSIIVYFCARWFGWNLPSFPDGGWYFNPFAWQLMFVFGAWCALGGSHRLQWAVRSRAVTVVAVAWLVFAFLIAMTWHDPDLGRFVPQWMNHALYPMGKPTMDPPRVLHFLAGLVLVARCLPSDPTRLSSWLVRPLILCGQHSLPVFCLGVLLSFSAHWILVEVSGSVAVQILVSFGGVALLVAFAWLLNWYRSLPEL